MIGGACRLAATLLVLCWPSLAGAADNPAPADEGPATWPDTLRQMFARATPRDIVRDPAAKRQLVDDADGLLVQLGITLVAQHADRSLTGRQDLVNATGDLAGAWRAWQGTGGNQGLLSWWLRGGDIIGAPEDTELQNEIGSVFAVNGALERKDTFVQELYWAQYFGSSLIVTAGQVDSSFRYDFNALANDERAQFLADPFVNSPSIPFPDPGLGLDARWVPADGVAIQAGAHQHHPAQYTTPDNQLFLAVEPTLSPTVHGLGDGTYRLLLYHLRTGKASGAGASFSADQQLGGGFAAFLRASAGDAAVSDFRRFLSAGLALAAPFARPDDVAAAAWAWGDPSAAGAGEEQFVELYYRAALNPYLELTPNLQFVIDPGRNPRDDLVTIFGLRLQANF